MSILTKDQILSAHDLKKIKIEVPEWGGAVYIKTITARERDQFEDTIYRSKKKIDISNVRAHLASLVLVDEKGANLFSADDINHLGRKSATAMDRVFSAGCKLNGMTPKDIEELEKNSSIIPGDSSTLS